MDRKTALRRMVMILFACTLLLGIIFAVISFVGRQYSTVDMTEVTLLQLEEVKDGDTIAIIETTAGEIRVVLYPDEAPETVANFISLAESGYYDGTYIYQAEKDGYFAAGSPQKDGSVDDNADTNERIPEELSNNLWPFKGAFCSVVTDTKSDFWDIFTGKKEKFYGSRFVVCSSIEMTDEIKEELRAANDDTTLADAFIEKGAVPNFSKQMTIFAQTYEGFDVIDEITEAELEKDEEGINRPVDDIIIESIEISTYSSKETTENQ